MDLVWVKFHGYKRFESGTLKIPGKVTAIIGPNEAGKSSILKALEHLNHNLQFSQSELTREKEFDDDDVILEAGFLLDDDDRATISDLVGDNITRHFRVSKLKNGNREDEIIPAIQQALSPRIKLKNFLEGLDESFLRKLKIDVNQIKRLIQELGNADFPINQEKLIDIKNDLSSISTLKINVEEKININKLIYLIMSVNSPSDINVNREAGRILLKQIPQILFFDHNQRNLQSTYDLSLYDFSTQNLPPALKNLVSIGDLSLVELKKAIENRSAAKIQTLLNKANLRITEAFKDKWTQSDVKANFSLEGAVLHILIEDGKRDCTDLDERSDGLRQFLALISFLEIKNVEKPPILLIDEAETHLHYDAQADLMNLFARQELASKIIYTTHSAGCLPEDIGTGVRCIIPDRNAGRSKIKNWFWEDNRPGFSPLLFAMGANSLAFIPVRKALFVEGATDMLLLPTIFRQISKRAYLGFQITPGLSVAAKSNLSLLENEAPRVAFLTDNDAAGKEIGKQLKDAGVNETRIFILPGEEGFVLEDCVSKKLYIEAVNNVFKNWNQESPIISLEDLPDPDINRPKKLAKWCEDQGIKPPDKRDIAYCLLDFATGERQEFLVRPDLELPMKKLYEDIAKELDI